MYHKDKWVSEKDCTKAEKNLLRKIKAATENNGFKDAKCSDCKQKGLFLYGMAIHTVADIFAHSTKGVPQKYQAEAALQKETLKDLCGHWKRYTHKENEADNILCQPDRWESAQNVCKKILDTSVYPHKAGKKMVFTEIKYYKKCSTAKNTRIVRRKKDMRLIPTAS